MSYEPGSVYTLLDLAKWLKFESWCQDPESFGGYKPQKDRARSWVDQQKETKAKTRPTTILHGSMNHLPQFHQRQPRVLVKALPSVHIATVKNTTLVNAHIPVPN